jgi:transmembrane sensor
LDHSETYLHELLAKEHWTEEECRWLLHYLEETPGTELKSLMLEHFRAHGLELPDQTLAENLLDRIHARMQPLPQTRVVPLYRRWWKGAAAAVIGVAAVMYFMQQPSKPLTAEIASATTEDVAPGSNKARLLLGNGKALVLDQMADGPISGDAQLHKEDAALVYGPSGGNSSNTLITPKGGQYRVQLEDGTKVWLNAASSLEYPVAFNGGDRTVRLTGEAYFEVAKNATKPFFVQVNGMTVQVLGTNFNINAYAEEKRFTTTLLEGAVRVVAGNQRLTLAPGEQTSLEQGILQRASGDAEDAIAWKNGIFTFKNHELAAVMRDISRWYDVNIIYDKGIDEKIHVTGAMRRQDNLIQALKILELTADLHFTVQGKTITVSKK